MKKDWKFFLTLFLSTFTLSAFTFGGGYVIVPLMRKRFVEKLGWISEDAMMDMICIAQSSPGPISINASILVGYRLAGFRGALMTVLGTATPPLFILSVLTVFYTAFRDNPVVNLVLEGMQAGVAGLITGVVLHMAYGILQNKRLLSLFLMISVFVSTVYLHINIVFILLLCGAIGAADTLWHAGHTAEGSA